MAKVARRFPVKTSLPLLLLIVSAHLIVLVLAAYLFQTSWVILVLLGALVLSAILSGRQYLSITRAPDDLCWSGENWLIQSEQPSGKIVYLTLMQSSWLSSFACLLHFCAGNQKHYWLFTRRGLGQSSYRELCYLVKQNISSRRKQA